jgi:hypothetical protein
VDARKLKRAVGGSDLDALLLQRLRELALIADPAPRSVQAGARAAFKWTVRMGTSAAEANVSYHEGAQPPHYQQKR